MTARVSLQAVADELERSAEASRAFMHCKTGELFRTTDDAVAFAEDRRNDATPEWEREEVRRIREMLNSSDWLELPSISGSVGYRIMEEFCVECCTGTVQDEILAEIHGRGAFGRFREEIYRRGLQDEWLRFRREKLVEIAAAWLEEQAIEYGD